MSIYTKISVAFLMVFGLISPMDYKKGLSVIKEITSIDIDDIAFIGNNFLVLHKECFNGLDDFFTRVVNLSDDRRENILTGRFPVINSTHLISAFDKKSVMWQYTIPGNEHQYVVCWQDYDSLSSTLSPKVHACEWPPQALGDHGALISNLDGNEAEVYWRKKGTWYLEKGITSFIQKNPGLYIVKYLPDNKALCKSININSGYYVYDFKKNEMSSFILFDNASPYNIECSSDGSFIAINDGAISILSLRDGQKKVLKIKGSWDDKDEYDDKVRSAIEFHPNNIILAWLQKNIIRYWDALTGEKYDIEHVYSNQQEKNILEQKLREPKRGISFSADGSRIAGLFGNMCLVFNVPKEVRYGLSYRKFGVIILALKEKVNDDLLQSILRRFITIKELTN